MFNEIFLLFRIYLTIKYLFSSDRNDENGSGYYDVQPMGIDRYWSFSRPHNGRGCSSIRSHKFCHHSYICASWYTWPLLLEHQCK